MDVHLSQYPVPEWKVRASSLVSYAQFGTLVGVMFGEGLCRSLGVPPPAFLNGPFLTENRIPLLAGVWLGGGTVSQSLLKTQAFEVYYDGEVVTSKLDTGVMPTREQILHGIRRRLAKEADGAKAGGAARPAGGAGPASRTNPYASGASGSASATATVGGGA